MKIICELCHGGMFSDYMGLEFTMNSMVYRLDIRLDLYTEDKDEYIFNKIEVISVNNFYLSLKEDKIL